MPVWDSAMPAPLAVPGLSRPLAIFTHGPEDRFVSRQLREQGMWEPYETSLLLQALQPGDVFVDVGANLGYFSLLAAERVGEEGRVFAFEPDPGNFALLANSLAHNGLAERVDAVCAGLAESAGEATLYLSEDNFGDHQLFATGQERRSVPVRLMSGTEYLSSRAARVNLVKVDTQGAEYAVMAGLLPLLQAQPQPARIIIELTPLSLRQAGASGRDLIGLLAQLAQPMWIIDHIEHRLVASDAQSLAGWCDNVDAVPGDAGFMNILVGPGL